MRKVTSPLWQAAVQELVHQLSAELQQAILDSQHSQIVASRRKWPAAAIESPVERRNEAGDELLQWRDNAELPELDDWDLDIDLHFI